MKKENDYMNKMIIAKVVNEKENKNLNKEENRIVVQQVLDEIFPRITESENLINKMIMYCKNHAELNSAAVYKLFSLYKEYIDAIYTENSIDEQQVELEIIHKKLLDMEKNMKKIC
jgi:hypothetical protein